ncbi:MULTISPECIES: DUF2809 domain-containing protein [unclassified Streptomyces]|uniref:ribosomal maturation YjgA family protein n=1 Tax=unclassified Streptomyces TaxID=2593676 RepID=UPI0033AD743E
MTRTFHTYGGGADPVRTRLAAAGAAVVTVGAGLGLRAVAAGDVAKYGGDALYTLMLLTLVVLVAPRVTPATAAKSALALSWAVEFLQLSGLPAELSQRSTLARLVLGSTFNPPDLFWYAVGAAAGCLIHTAVRGRRCPYQARGVATGARFSGRRGRRSRCR